MHAHICFASDIALYSPIPFPSSCISTIFQFRRVGQDINYLKLYPPSSFPYKSFYIFYPFIIVSFPFLVPCHCLCFCCTFVCALIIPPRGGWEYASTYPEPSSTPPLRHTPSSSANFTCIFRHLYFPLYIILDLVGIPTNDIANIVVNLIA